MNTINTQNAEELHRRYSVDNKSTREWLTELAEANNCEIQYSNSIERQECVYVNSNGQSVISIPVGVSEARNNFTIAHELGHVILHHNEGSCCYHRSLQIDDPKEQQANAFAANLLMPEKEFREAASKVNNNSHMLARRFDVSELAARVRLKALRITDSI